MMCGGHSAVKQVEPEMAEFFMNLRPEIEKKTGDHYENFELVEYTS